MEPGYRIEHYVLIEQIGQGGQAAVWSAQDEQLKRTVAIKTINLRMAIQPDAAQSAISKPPSIEEQAQRFRSEAQTIADLEHPFILPIYSYGQKDDWLYIVMRYMAGGTLRKIIHNQTHTLEEVIKLAEPLADALSLAHQRKIVHRDIKSVNILLDAQNRPYLADFGLSVTMGESSGGGSGSGTIAYMAPEQIKDQPFDHRSDIYSFGMLIYEMFTGSLPTYNDQSWNIAQAMNGTLLPIPPEIPYGVDTILQRALAADPNDRYNNVTDLVADLRGLVQTPTSNEVDVDSILLPITDPAMQAAIEAQNLFSAALEKWADGAGRFRLYEEDFKYVDSFYNSGDSWGMDLDDAAKRLLLRGALEHGYNLDYWWKTLVSTADRRAVTLQTLTSELATSRLRAIEHLTTIGDSDPPAIPTRVATIISKDNNADVQLAGVKLLAKRAPKATNWRPTAYNDSIDGVLADLAVKSNDPRVAYTAAETIGRLYSQSAVQTIANKALGTTEQTEPAFDALIKIREQVPNLPQSVPSGLRQRIFTAVSIRQFFQLGLITRWFSAALGFGLGWAIFTYVFFNKELPNGDLLLAQAIGNALASAVFTGLAVGVGVVVASETAARLRAWTRAGRIVLGLIAGTLVSAIAFILIRNYYYLNPDPINWPWMLGFSLIFISGFAISSGLTEKTWKRALAGMLGVFIASFGSYVLRNQTALLDFPITEQLPLAITEYNVFDQAILYNGLLAILLGILAYLPEWINALRRRRKSWRRTVNAGLN